MNDSAALTVLQPGAFEWFVMMRSFTLLLVLYSTIFGTNFSILLGMDWSLLWQTPGKYEATPMPVTDPK